eukprot:2649682-Rhodomonas_salina.1
MSYLKPRATAITVCCLGKGSGQIHRQPCPGCCGRRLHKMGDSRGFQIPERSYEHTWRATDGPQRAHLDYMLVWSAEAV